MSQAISEFQTQVRSWQAVASAIDHTLLKPEASREQIIKLSEEAVYFGFAAVCVNPCWISLAASVVHGTPVKVATTIGFPLGANSTTTKRFETAEAIRLGAHEIDMVMNIPALKNNDKSVFFADVEGVITAGEGVKVKVITENCFLTQEEKRRACYWISQAGAHFVKTSTAYADGGATLDDVRLMYEAVDGRCQVKAAGGIRKIEEILEYLRAGARRFGSTRTDQFVQAFREMPEGKRESFGEFLFDLTI